MFQVVILDNSGYESEVVHVLPHRYAMADEALAEVESLKIYVPSTRFASWSVRETAELAGQGWPSAQPEPNGSIR